VQKKPQGLDGDGKVPFRALHIVIGDIWYKGWIDLETSGRSKPIEDDMKKNLAYLRVLLAS
jgi:hypothetical protein